MWYEAADGTPVELQWYRDVDPLVKYLGGKVGRGICSACYCEEQAEFLTVRSGRHWALCREHARTLTTGYWRPGMVMETPPRKHARPGRKP